MEQHNEFVCKMCRFLHRQLHIAIICSYTVVWEKFTVGYFHVKIVRGKIVSSLGVSDENFLTTKYFKIKLFVPLLTNLMHNYT